MAKNFVSFCLVAFLASSIAGFPRSLDMSEELAEREKAAAEIVTAPYHVSLRLFRKHSCGGVILNSRWIITSASCVDGQGESSYSVVAGITNIRNPEATAQIRQVSDLVLHEKFIPEEDGSNNIAVVKLTTPLTLGVKQNALAIPLISHSIKPGTPANATGWAKSDVLRKARLSILPDNCGGYSNDICAATVEGDKGACVFEYGVPLVVKDKANKQVLAGIYTDTPDRKCTRSIYTDISKYIGWINSKISK